MSYLNSNLDALGYDMVVALTQDSVLSKQNKDVNTTYVPSNQTQLVRMYKTTSITPLSIEEANDLGSANDLFALPSGCTASTGGSSTQQTLVHKLESQQFSLAIRATVVRFPPSASLPPLFAFPTSPYDRQITYNIYFQKVEIVQLVSGAIVKYVQNPPTRASDYWIFKCRMDLSIVSEVRNYGDLTEKQLEALENFGGGPYTESSTFRQHSLLLDFNSSQNIMDRVSLYLDSALPNASSIQSLFVNNQYLELIALDYWNLLGDNGHRFIITIAPNSPGPYIPSAIDFQFRPNSAAPGQSTINYLIMQDGKSLPGSSHETRPLINWDWMSADDDIANDGVVAISKTNTFNAIIRFFNPYLGILCKGAYGAIHDESSSKNVTIGAFFQDAIPGWDPTFQLAKTSDGKRIQLDWVSLKRKQTDGKHSNSYAEVQLHSYPYFDFITKNDRSYLACRAGAGVYLKGNFTAGGDTSDSFEGNCYYTDAGKEFQLGVSGSTITFTPMVPTPQTGYTIDDNISWWRGTIPWSTIPGHLTDHISQAHATDMVNDVQGKYDPLIKEYFNQVEAKIPEKWSAIPGFVYPGGVLYSYQSCMFSENLDIVTKIKYVS